jgi:hypothetical protein
MMPHTEDCHQLMYILHSLNSDMRGIYFAWLRFRKIETGEVLILWRHLQISLYLLGRPPQPGLS